MRLLVRADGSTHYVAHIPDAQGRPLCQSRLNLAVWQIRDCSVEKLIICATCRHIQAQEER
jgi:hypothetical protein